MMRSMFAGVSGLRNHQIKMDVIGNNIANVNTVGYKTGRANFQDALNQYIRGASAPRAGRGGSNALQVGLGVNIASIDIIHTQGNLQTTGKVSDIAIQGDGFFVLGDGTGLFFTRAGNLNLESSGYLSAPNGLALQGWMADIAGDINTNAPISGIQLPIGQNISPSATSLIQFGGNLDSRTTGTLSYPELTIDDGAGHYARVSYILTPTANYNEYNYVASVSNGTITSGTGTGTITLDINGNVTGVTGGDFAVTPVGSGAVPIRIQPPASGAAEGGTFVSQALSYPTLSIDDGTGHTADIAFTLTPTGIPYQYAYSGAVSNGATGIISGTITLDAAGNVVASTGGPFTLTYTDLTTATLDGPTVGASEGGVFAVGATQSQALFSTYDFTGLFEAPKPLVTSTQVYDSQGKDHTVTTTVTKTDVNTWSWEVTDQYGVALGNGTLSFDTGGQLISAPGTAIVLTPSGANPMSISPDFSGVTQFASALSEITSPFQDGFSMGQLQSFNIDKTGKIIGVFSNGRSQTLAQLAIANFTNPSGLVRVGDSMFATSANSGTPQIGQAGLNGRGDVTPGALEMSNVDLSQEFTDMIVTQRGFQSNSRIITTSDEMLQELVSLKR